VEMISNGGGVRHAAPQRVEDTSCEVELQSETSEGVRSGFLFGPTDELLYLDIFSYMH